MKKTGKEHIPATSQGKNSQKILNAAELIEEAKKYNGTDAFWSEERREKSNLEWKRKCQLLKEAIALGSAEAKEIYSKSIESKYYSKDLADCWIIGHENEIDVRVVTAFFWEQIAAEVV